MAFNQFRYNPIPNFRGNYKAPLNRRNKFKEDPQVRRDYDKKRWSQRLRSLELGCIPMSKLHFDFCKICGVETVNYKTTIRETCGRTCGHKLGMQRKNA